MDSRRTILSPHHLLLLLGALLVCASPIAAVSGPWEDEDDEDHDEREHTNASVFPQLAVSDRISLWHRCVVDSWDRASGAFEAEAVLSTNSTSSGRVRLGGDARINGDVYVGPGGHPDSVIRTWGDSEITGETGRLSQAVDIPDYGLPDDLPPREGDLRLSNQETITISTSRRFRSLRLADESVLTVNAPVDIVVEGALEIANSAQVRMVETGRVNLFVSRSAGIYNDALVNAVSADPSRLRIYMMGSDKIELSGSPTMYAQVHHRNGEMEVWGESRFFGTYVGRDFEAGDRARIHLDPSSPGGSTSAGRTFYVRVSGSDSNSGFSPASAWRTIDRAADVMAAGDKVFVGPGRYEERITPRNDGTLEQPIEFIADVTGEQTGDSPGAVVVAGSGDSVLWVDDDDYVVFAGFVFEGGSNAVVEFKDCIGGQLVNCVIRNASGYSGDGIEIDDADLVIEGCEIIGNRDDGIALRSEAQATIIASKISRNGGDGIYASDDDNTLIIRRSCIISNDKDGVRVVGSSTIVNTLIADNGRNGVMTDRSSGVDVTVVNCTIIENDDDGLRLRGGRMSVVNSIIAFNDEDGFDRDGGSIEHSHNILFGNGDNFSGTSKHSTELLVDPLLAGGTDHRLLVNSPAIDAGTSLSNVTTTDLDSTSRPTGDRWDIGCYEGEGVTLLFADVSKETGFAQVTTTHDTFGSGWHWGDLDDDGDLDAIATGNESRLFINQGSGHTFFVTAFGGSVRRQGALVDLDNDGDLDFWAGNDNSYYDAAFIENDGHASFTNRGDLTFAQPSNNEGIAAADVDRDGWCDVIMFSENGNWIGLNSGGAPPLLTGTNAMEYGLNEHVDVGNGDYVSSSDVNDDGLLDFFYHYNSGRLFLSDGDGTYTCQPHAIDVVTGPDDKFGSAWGDYDNDGDPDLFVPGHRDDDAPSLWRNDQGTFTDVAAEAGLIARFDQRSACWGDYDNDGHLDLYVVTRSGSNILYRNNGDGTFDEVNEGALAAGNGHDAVFVDYDNDGDLDLAVTREDEPAVLLRNNLNNDGYLLVRVLGAGAGATPRSANCVRIELFDAAGVELVGRREIGTARGFGGTEPMWAHFGGVDPESEYTLRVHFASQVREIKVVPRDVSSTVGANVIAQMITVRESATEQVRVIRWREVEPADR